MDIRGVIFDLDGTLLDTLADIACAMNRVLAGRGLAEYPLSRLSLVSWATAQKFWCAELSPDTPPAKR